MLKTFKNLIPIGVVACLAVIGVSPASATLTGDVNVTPGSTVFPGDVTGQAPGTLLADTVQAFSITTAVGLMTGTIESAVYQEAGGTLDFYYQVTNTSPDGDSYTRNSDSSFSGWLTNVGSRTDGSTLTGTTFANSTFVPDTADRGATNSGAVVGFNFNAFGTADEIPVGSKSAVLVIDTNATQWKLGTASAIDSGTATVPAYEPTSTVPEPGSIVMLGSALLGLAALGRRRFAN